MSKEKITVAVGPAGEWGSAFAKVAAEKGHDVCLYMGTPEDVLVFQQTHRTRRLAGVDMPSNIQATSDKEEFVKDADLIVLAPPSKDFRSFWREIMPFIDPQTDRLILTKGLEQGTNLRMSEILLEQDPTSIDRIAVLSGPNLAKEVARSVLSGTVVAAYNLDTANRIQSWFNSEHFRVYTSDDPVGVEFGGALKNVMALGAGIADELKASSTSKALYFTRALEEMIRFGTALGGHEATFRGLSGEGDLFLSCIDGLTRNHRAGIRIAQGLSKAEILSIELVEGLYTIQSAVELARLHHIDVPIVDALYKVICGDLTIHEGINQLMGRQPTKEQLADKGLRFRLVMFIIRVLHKIGIRSLL